MVNMEEETKKDEDQGHLERAYELHSWASKGQDVTVRDDQYGFPWLLDSAKVSRKRGFRFRLVDSGNLDCSQMEWLAEAGADIYTSDEARSEAFELDLLIRACRRAGSIVAYFHNGPLEQAEGGKKQPPLLFSELLDLARSGLYLHLTNKTEKREFSLLNTLAHACQMGESWLVYYHHGPLEPALEELARNRAWIHMSDRSLEGEEDVSILLDTVKSARSSRTNIILHLDKGIESTLLSDIVRSGAIVLFDLTHLEEASLLRAAKGLDFRAYYLYPQFLPG